MLHPTTASADNAGRTGLWPPVFLRVQSGGVRGHSGTRGMFESRSGRPTGRVGELGEVGSPLAVERLHTVICGQRAKLELAVVLMDRHVKQYHASTFHTTFTLMLASFLTLRVKITMSNVKITGQALHLLDHTHNSCFLFFP